MSKIKNVIVVYDFAIINGGAAKVAIQSAIALKKRGLNVVYFSATSPIDKEMVSAGIEVISLDSTDINTEKNRLKAIKMGIYNSKSKKVFKKVLEKFNKDDTIIHLHGWSRALSVSIINAAQKNKFKCVITLHDYFSVCPNGGFYNYKKNKICKCMPMSATCVCTNCDKRNYLQKLWRISRQVIQDLWVKNNKNMNYIYISELNKKVVKENVKSNAFYYVPNIVELSEKKLQKITQEKVFLYVGRVSIEKGVDLFCNAINELKDEQVRGIVVGTGPVYETLRKKYDNVQFVGWKNSEWIQEYYKKARALVFPSRWYEGAPLTIVEAMSANLPCIVSDCTSAKELIVNGENGFVFETGNLDSLVKNMRRALNQEKIEEIRTNIEEKFNISAYKMESHVSNLICVYDKILSETR